MNLPVPDVESINITSVSSPVPISHQMYKVDMSSTNSQTIIHQNKLPFGRGSTSSNENRAPEIPTKHTNALKLPLIPKTSPVPKVSPEQLLPLPTATDKKIPDPIFTQQMYTKPVKPIKIIGPSSPTKITESTKPNYDSMSTEEQNNMRVIFKAKFGKLRIDHPSMNIQDPPETYTLDQIHDVYHNYVKQIVISMNSDQWRSCLVLFFLGIEFFGIKVLGLDFRGFTMAQVKSMHRYDSLLVELGEKYYSQGASSWSVEHRFMAMAGFNAIIFVIIKFISEYIGGENFANTIHSFIESFSNVGNVFSQPSQPKQTDEFGLPEAPKKSAAPAGGLNLDSIFGMLGGGGGGGSNLNLSSVIANFGNMMTKNMNPNKPVEKSEPTTTKKRVVFSN